MYLWQVKVVELDTRQNFLAGPTEMPLLTNLSARSQTPWPDQSMDLCKDCALGETRGAPFSGGEFAAGLATRLKPWKSWFSPSSVAFTALSRNHSRSCWPANPLQWLTWQSKSPEITGPPGLILPLELEESEHFAASWSRTVSGEPQFEKLPSSGKTTADCQWDHWGWESLSCHWGSQEQQWRDQERQKWLISSTHSSISCSELTNSVQGNAILIAGNRYSTASSRPIPRSRREWKPKLGNHSSGMFAVQRNANG